MVFGLGRLDPAGIHEHRQLADFAARDLILATWAKRLGTVAVL
jgi:hypothetical protein